MKVYNIGRGEENDIIVYDESGMVSRKHAILKTRPLGKYILIDVSKNGTTVNGRRIPPKQPVKVGRKDVVSFAKKSLLDWKEVPREHSVPVLISLCAIGVGVVCLLIWLAVNLFSEVYHKEKDSVYDVVGGTVGTEDGSARKDTVKDNTRKPDASKVAEEEISVIGADGIEFTDRPVVKGNTMKGEEKKKAGSDKTVRPESPGQEQSGEGPRQEENNSVTKKKKVRRS